LNTLPEYLMSSMVFSGVRIAQSIVLCDMLWLSFNVLLSLGYCFRILVTIFRHFVLLHLVIVETFDASKMRHRNNSLMLCRLCYLMTSLKMPKRGNQKP
jgi:hypothetical protein